MHRSRTWMAHVVTACCHDHRKQLHVGEPATEVLRQQHGAQGLHHVRGVRSIVVRIVPVPQLNSLQHRMRINCPKGLCFTANL